MRVLNSPTDTGAVVLSLPQDLQSHAYDFPAGFFRTLDGKTGARCLTRPKSRT